MSDDHSGRYQAMVSTLETMGLPALVAEAAMEVLIRDVGHDQETAYHLLRTAIVDGTGIPPAWLERVALNVAAHNPLTLPEARGLVAGASVLSPRQAPLDRSSLRARLLAQEFRDG